MTATTRQSLRRLCWSSTAWRGAATRNCSSRRASSSRATRPSLSICSVRTSAAAAWKPPARRWRASSRIASRWPSGSAQCLKRWPQRHRLTHSAWRPSASASADSACSTWLGTAIRSSGSPASTAFSNLPRMPRRGATSPRRSSCSTAGTSTSRPGRMWRRPVLLRGNVCGSAATLTRGSSPPVWRMFARTPSEPSPNERRTSALVRPPRPDPTRPDPYCALRAQGAREASARGLGPHQRPPQEGRRAGCGPRARGRPLPAPR